MYRKTVLDNGLRIVSEEISHFKSVSIGVWVPCGSRDEEQSSSGTAHFIEHMLFKGTPGRSAFDIAYQIDSIGGIINACTDKETTTLYLKVPDYHLGTALDIMADILNYSLFDLEEISKEQSVVFQEIRMVNDTPDEYIYDFFAELFWHGHPLGLPILGSEASVRSLSRNTLLDFFHTHYHPENLVLAAAGNVNHDDLVKRVRQLFPDSFLKCRSGHARKSIPTTSSRQGLLQKDLEQVHAIIGTLAPSFTSPDRYACFLLNTILGGSMSSRLFQEIREKRGLAYAIHSFLTSYRDIGELGIYVGTSHEQFNLVMDLIFKEMTRISSEPLTGGELKAAHEQLKGSFLLGMESTDSRMTRLAKNELYFEEYIPLEYTIRQIEKVTAEDVLALSGRLFRPETVSIAALGMLDKQDLSLRL